MVYELDFYLAFHLAAIKLNKTFVESMVPKVAKYMLQISSDRRRNPELYLEAVLLHVNKDYEIAFMKRLKAELLNHGKITSNVKAYNLYGDK